VVYGLDTMSSDLDCGIRGCNEDVFVRFLMTLTQRLKAAPQSYGRVIPILKGRVPIVRFTDVRNKIDVDVSLLKTESQLIKTSLLVNYRQLDDRVAVLIHLVKLFARASCLGDASLGGLNSFGWTMLTLQFCQLTQPPVIPNLQAENTVTTGWVSQNKQDVGTLLFDFLMFYTRQFRPFRDCVSVRSGTFISASPYRTYEDEENKEEEGNTHKQKEEGKQPEALLIQPGGRRVFSREQLVALMPREGRQKDIEDMRARTAVVHKHAKFASTIASCYAGYVRSLLLPERVGFHPTQRTFLCIEDPVDRADNVARGITGATIVKIYKAMLRAIEVFQSPELSFGVLFHPSERPLSRHAIKKQRLQEAKQAEKY